MIEIQTSKIIVVDPSRRKDIWCKLIISNCVNGFWKSEKTFVNGIPNQFIVSLDGVELNSEWIEVSSKVFTHCKHIAIGDYEMFPDNGFRDSFQNILDFTAEDLEKIWSNEYTFVTLHNHTDWEIGNHTCYVQLNEEGEAIAVKLTYK